MILISTVGQLFCGVACLTSASRMTFAFSRDGAVPGHNLWRRLSRTRTPTWAVFFVVLFALIVTIPAYFPNHLGTPVAFLAVTSISVIGLYIAYTIPVYLRWRMGDSFQAGPWTLGNKYKWINPIAFVWVAICVVIFCLPFSPEGVFFEERVQLVGGQLRPDRHDRDDAGRDDLVLGLGEKNVQGPDSHDRRPR